MKMRRRRSRTGPWPLLCLAVSTLGLPACETTDSTPLPAEITLTLSPDPVTAVPSTDTDHQWSAQFTVTVTESAGISGTITSVSAVLYEAAGGIVVVSGEEVEYNIRVDSNTNSLAANGSVPILFSADYSLPGGGREAAVDVTVSMIDDNGYSQSEAIRITVQ